MKLKEFKESIDKAEKNLKYKDGSFIKYEGICVELEWCFANDAARDKFIELFKHKYKFQHPYWIGALNEKNYRIRKMVLREFEVICINDKLYLEF